MRKINSTPKINQYTQHWEKAVKLQRTQRVLILLCLKKYVKLHALSTVGKV